MKLTSPVQKDGMIICPIEDSVEYPNAFIGATINNSQVIFSIYKNANEKLIDNFFNVNIKSTLPSELNIRANQLNKLYCDLNANEELRKIAYQLTGYPLIGRSNIRKFAFMIYFQIIALTDSEQPKKSDDREVNVFGPRPNLNDLIDDAVERVSDVIEEIECSE